MPRKAQQASSCVPSQFRPHSLAPTVSVVGRGHVSLLISLDTRHSKAVWGMGRRTRVRRRRLDELQLVLLEAVVVGLA